MVYKETIKATCINCGKEYDKDYWRKTKDICPTCLEMLNKQGGMRWIKKNYLINKGGN